jgi:hypothetical protein
MSGKPGQRNVFWTAEEIAILEREWPKAGYAGVRELLPQRSLCQIRGMVGRRQIHVEGRAYVKQPATEWIDAAIVRAYRTAPKKPDIKALAKSLGRTHGWVKWRAQVLGVARFGISAIGKPHQIWTDEENACLEQGIERGLSVPGLHNRLKRQGYHRSHGAIHEQLCKLGMKVDRNWWTALETAQALAVDESVIRTWINRGWLKAQKRHGPTADPAQTEPAFWAIDRKDLRQFLQSYPRAWDHRRVRIEVLLELLCFDKNRQGLGQFNSASDLPETA